MSEATLREHEQDVVRARAKLAGDLAILRSPFTFAAFKEDVKHEALDAKDALVQKAKSTAQSAVNELLEDLKAKAAANPAAALTIGAGIAWRLIQHPPIATALIGAGVFSLWRTPTPRPRQGAQPDYLLRGKERLREQAGEVASSLKETAADVGQAVAAKATDFVDAAKEKVQELADNTRDTAMEAGSALRSAAESRADQAGHATRAFADRAQRTVANASGNSVPLIQETVSDEEGASGQQSRDRVLLGIAGVAVMAALGMAYQKRFTEDAKID